MIGTDYTDDSSKWLLRHVISLWYISNRLDILLIAGTFFFQIFIIILMMRYFIFMDVVDRIQWSQNIQLYFYPPFFINILMVDTDMCGLVMKRLHGYGTNTWRKRKRDKIIKNCIENKYVNEQIVKKGDIHVIGTCD